VLITGTGACSSLLAAKYVDIPVTQSSLNYLFLSFHLLWTLRNAGGEGLGAPVWHYVLWALCDVEANFLVVWAYQYTSIASVMLLDCFAIPCTMLLSRTFLGAQYTLVHLIACCICIAGLLLTVESDLSSGRASVSPSGPAWLGDVLVLCGAMLYGVSNVAQARLVEGGRKRCEALGMLGLWGTLISCLQVAILEREKLVHTLWTAEKLIYLFGFQLCLFGVYVLTSAFLSFADATLFNLSLLTSDFYGVFFSWRVQHKHLTFVYVVAFITTISGLVVYHVQPVEMPAPPA